MGQTVSIRRYTVEKCLALYRLLLVHLLRFICIWILYRDKDIVLSWRRERKKPGEREREREVWKCEMSSFDRSLKLLKVIIQTLIRSPFHFQASAHAAIYVPYRKKKSTADMMLFPLHWYWGETAAWSSLVVSGTGGADSGYWQTKKKEKKRV